MTELQHITVPLVDPATGRATTSFYRYLRTLNRTVDDVGDDESPPTFESMVVTAAAGVDELRDGVVAIDARLTELQSTVAELQATVPPPNLIFTLQEDVAELKGSAAALGKLDSILADVECLKAIVPTLRAPESPQEPCVAEIRQRVTDIEGHLEELLHITTSLRALI